MNDDDLEDLTDEIIELVKIHTTVHNIQEWDELKADIVKWFKKRMLSIVTM